MSDKIYRILVVDDDPEVRRTFKEILDPETYDTGGSELRALESQLFADKSGGYQTKPKYSLSLYAQAPEAVEAVRQAIAEDDPFSLAFVDVRLPPGPDGVWAASQMRLMDPYLEIVIVTAFSDLHPAKIAEKVPPPDKLLYLQKPFTPQEIEHFALSLGAKWKSMRMLGEYQRSLERRVAERTMHLEEVNTALKVLMNNLEDEKLKQEQEMHATLDKLVMPYLDSLAAEKLDERQKALLEAAMHNLRNVASNFASRFNALESRLTPTELRIADLLKQGKTTKEIAMLVNLSDATISTHRASIRRKLGLVNRRVNLKAYLQAQS